MTTTDQLTDRYGAPSPLRRRSTLVAAVVVIALFSGWLAWTVWEQSRPLVASGELTFDVVDDNTATARFRIDLREDDVDATCTLTAFAENHETVGEIAFTPEPSPGGVVEQDIRTTSRATSVELEGCTAPGQLRPR